MENIDDSENNAKISDSAYSNSCSNSQSRRSHSSKSTHSGSHSSGSSGYGGKQSTSGSSNNLDQQPKKEKESKKKKLIQSEIKVPDVVAETATKPSDPVPNFEDRTNEETNVIQISSSVHVQNEKVVENMDIVTTERNNVNDEDGFSCVISMHDGVVTYTTSSLTTTLGFPKDMWIGRSFIDFIHPRDRSTFASQITNGLAIPKTVNGTQEKVESPANSVSSMVCRIRRYRGLLAGFGVKERVVSFLTFLLKLTFKNVSDESGKVIYLVIQATPFYSAYKVPHEAITKATPFVIRHAANGGIEYVDPEAVPYTGYLPQDLTEKNALLLYHPDDLCYLHQVYETIVKKGSLQRSKPYRMLIQNGGYVKLETEWSSFINPWSRKLEFVIGKHHIIEGPANPDVFHTADTDKSVKVSEEEKNKAQLIRDNIIRTLTEVLTKPAEVAKQQMSKRCQDLASFMESLMEEQPKTDEELRLEIHDADHSYYERDSLMLGGISPHHDYNDSKSSTGTPLSYNQLNYNETLQRYFESHQPCSYEDCNTVRGENILGLTDTRLFNNSPSPMPQRSRDSAAISSSCDANLLSISDRRSDPSVLYPLTRLTESLLSKHNSEMEKELMKNYREMRSSSKGEREKATNETRQKKKEHLTRCNASYQPTSVIATTTENQPHGVKRASKHVDTEANAHKHHCTSARQSRRKNRTLSTTAATIPPPSTATTTVATSHWATQPVNSMNMFFLGVGIPQQISIMSPVPAMPVQYMMYGQPMYGSPFMYPPMNQQVSYPTQQMMTQPMEYNNAMNRLGLTSRNYEEACKPSLTLRPGKLMGTWRDKMQVESEEKLPKMDVESADSNSSTKELNRESGASTQIENGQSTLYSSDMKSSTNSYSAKMNTHGHSEETIDKTDGESSYSSFYSSFFKTESGSAEDSGDRRKSDGSKEKRIRSPMGPGSKYYEPQKVKKVARRKMGPPWLEQVCVTSELVYKYQILTKTMEEVLSADKLKMNTLEQPSLVNEQLSQLYLDLQLEGVAARLTLEEGITSSSSSGEETSTKTRVQGTPRRKREYSKLVMIYEEDAPLPPPLADTEPEEPIHSVAGASTSTF